MPRKDYTGSKFGRLTLLEFLRYDNGSRQIYKCLCECGNICEGNLSDMKGGGTKSCGCFHRETVAANGRKKTIGDGVAAINALISNYKSAAKDRGVDWDLTKEQFLEITSQHCFYCGIEPLQNKGTSCNTGSYKHNGIDRIDSSMGYRHSNCVPCCKNCNYAKRKMSVDEFFDLIEKIYNKHIIKRKKGLITELEVETV